MSINCSNFCIYQIDGTCMLKNGDKKNKTKRSLEVSDCLYFEKSNKLC